MEAPVAISIAGSDNSAGAGIQADLKTFTYFKVFGQTVVTCVVAEVPGRVTAIHPIDPKIVKEQLTLSLQYFPVRAMKTGMLYSTEIIQTVCEVIESLPSESRPYLVVDPVMVASSGDLLLEPDAVALYRNRLIPLATVVTPNLHEAITLANRTIRNIEELEEVARSLAERYRVAFLVKAGTSVEWKRPMFLFLVTRSRDIAHHFRSALPPMVPAARSPLRSLPIWH
jgi:hydroxymethylpyrimidine/phosphomethylpyrimidine kinase